jgi:hypothetical protein
LPISAAWVARPSLVQVSGVVWRALMMRGQVEQLRPQVSVGAAVIRSLAKASAAEEPLLGMVGCSMTSAPRQLPVAGQAKQLY